MFSCKSNPQWDIISHLLEYLSSKRQDNKCWWGCGEKRTLVHYWWECKFVQHLCKTIWSFLKNLKIELLSDPAISLLGIYSKEMKSLSQGYLPSHVHWSIIHNSQDVEKPKCPSMDEWIMKNVRTCNIMDRPWGHCAKWNSQERQMLHGITYMWNLKEKKVKLIEKRVEK